MIDAPLSSATLDLCKVCSGGERPVYRPLRDGELPRGTPRMTPCGVGDAVACYGIAKAGQNDCASTGNNSCAGTRGPMPTRKRGSTFLPATATQSSTPARSRRPDHGDPSGRGLAARRALHASHRRDLRQLLPTRGQPTRSPAGRRAPPPLFVFRFAGMHSRQGRSSLAVLHGCDTSRLTAAPHRLRQASDGGGARDDARPGVHRARRWSGKRVPWASCRSGSTSPADPARLSAEERLSALATSGLDPLVDTARQFLKSPAFRPAL
jgi:hypothetical protein